MTENQIYFSIVGLSLLAGIELFLVLLPTHFFYRRPPPLPRPQRNVWDFKFHRKLIAILLAGLIGGFLFVVGMASLEPGGYDPFHAPPQELTAVILSPRADNLVSLIKEPVTLSREEINQVCKALNTANVFKPNHPGARWRCSLTFRTATESVTVNVSETKSEANGLLIYWWSPNLRLNMGTRRCDQLGPLLEKIAARKGVPTE